MNDMVLILDFGGAYSQAVAKKVRFGQVYCEVLSYHESMEVIRQKEPKGIILVGGPQDAATENAPNCDLEVYEMGIPILGMGYGARILCRTMGGDLRGSVLEGRTALASFSDTPIFAGMTEGERFFERADYMELPECFVPVATANGLMVAFACEAKRMYGLQMHVEQNDPDSILMLANFTVSICACQQWWSMEAFTEQQVELVRQQVGDGKALMAMSGGVDSSVCAALMHKAIGDQLYCLYVDTGLMRKGESDRVESLFKDDLGINVIRINAQDRFISKLAGITDPELKRKTIGEEFIRVFEEEARKLGKIEYLVQGTIYPDIIESFGVDKTVIKSHHNVGGLPETIDFKALVEPVRQLFKDEVRKVGEVLGLPPSVIYRQPFPGPGLAVRCIGEVTAPRLEILREADAIYREEITKAGLDKKIWQYFVVLTNMLSVGIRNNKRSYEYTVALRAVHSIDAMAATTVRLPYDLLERVADRITSEVKGINRVVYDITGKPPAIIEWE